MPSDAKKKQQQKKKDAAKARQSGKKPVGTAKPTEDGKEQSPALSDVQNGTNGAVTLSAEGQSELVRMSNLISYSLFQLHQETNIKNLPNQIPCF